jgi:predicted nucleic acid-binding protein
MLFDTTFFIDLEQELHAGIPGAAAAFLQKAKRAPKAVSTVTIGEFAVGASDADTRRMFRGYRPVALGRDTAIFAGRLQASLPFRIGENDLWIAATALRFGLPLVSNDAKTFPRIPKLKLYRY